MENAVEVDSQNFVPHHLGHLEERLVTGDSGVVDEDVDGAEVLGHGVDHGFGVRLARDVGLIGIGLNTELARGAADLVRRFDGILIVDGHRRAGLGQNQRGGLADAARTAGHEGPFSRQHFVRGQCFQGLVPRGLLHERYCAHVKISLVVELTK